MQSVYQTWGFLDNPFTTIPLQADERGAMLLIGRDEELTKLRRRIVNAPKIPTVEGAIGIGKTSLVNVAAYDLFRTYVTSADATLIIPCRRVFQLTSQSDSAEFIDDVVREVAQTLIERSVAVKKMGVSIANRNAVDKWLNSPTMASVQAGLQVFGVGVSGGKSIAQNTGQGFERSGFRKLVFNWLQDIFSDQGGVVCVIDNLELLEQSAAARQAVETLRDELLLVPGLRWVLCGANGIVQSVVSSPRLQGILYAPIEVAGIRDEHIPQILQSRIAVYAAPNESAYLPITTQSFDFLYQILNRNLRNLLSFADDFCQWVADAGAQPIYDEDKDKEFHNWLTETAQAAHAAVARQLRPRAWSIFDKAIQLGGAFSPSDYGEFGCASIPALRPHVKDLEAVGMLQSSRDDADQRRKSIAVTSKGYLISYYRKQLQPSLTELQM